MIDKIIFYGGTGQATNYYKEDRYPNPNYCLPSRDEINEVLDFTEKLFVRVCNILNINIR